MGRNGQTRLARSNSKARMGDREKSFSLYSRPREGLATIPVDPFSAENADHATPSSGALK